MGDFTLYHRDKLPEIRREAALSCLACAGSVNPVIAEHGRYIFHCFPKQLSPVQNFFADRSGNFCGSSGTFIYRGKMGQAALESLLDDFTPDHYQPENFEGLFTVILRKDNRLYLLTDPMGGNKLYQNDEENFWSSSFLATVSACSSLSPNPQAIYEYAFQETTYGTDSVFQEVTTLDSLKIFEVTSDGLVARDKQLTFDFEPSPASQDDLVHETGYLLREMTGSVSRAFPDRIHTALSGGYDSRLMLALLQDSGVSPGVYVYGPDSSPDVIIARLIAEGEGFALDHIDKALYPVPSTGDYTEIIKDNFYALDGLPGEGIFDFGANMATRRKRADKGHMVFNGGGGEIFRNFFYLPDRNYTISDLISCFYSRYSTGFCQDVFDERRYRDNLHEKIRTALGVPTDCLKRTEVEYIYPAFRLRYWTARDNNNNSRLGPYLTPFISYRLIRQALTIPLDMKNHGQFQAKLIRMISPTLASYPSDYGYPFDEAVPAKAKLKNYMTYYRPLFLRRRSYALQQHLASLQMPETLRPIFNSGCPCMAQYFKIDQITDAALLGRIYTMEYLFNYFGIG